MIALRLTKSLGDSTIDPRCIVDTSNMASLSLKVEWWCPLLLARLWLCASGGCCGGNRAGPRPPSGAGLNTGLPSLSLDSSWRFGKEPIVITPFGGSLSLRDYSCDASSRAIRPLARSHYDTGSHRRDRRFPHPRVGHLNKKNSSYRAQQCWFTFMRIKYFLYRSSVTATM